MNEAGYFNVSIPLNMLLRFAQDYFEIIVNVKYKLVLGAAVAEWSKAYVLYCSYIPLRRSWVRFPLGVFSVMVFSWLERILTGMESRYNVKSYVKKGYHVSADYPEHLG